MSIKIEVSEKGAELTSLKLNNKEMLHDGKSFWNRQSPILFPTVGRLHNNVANINGKAYEIPQHGFAKDLKFNLVKNEDNVKEYELESNEETYINYPFKFKLNVRYETAKDTLKVYYKVINMDDFEMYFGIGGHPGFKINSKHEEYYFKLEKEEKNVEFMEVEGDYISNKVAKNILENKQIINIGSNSFINDAIMMKNLDSKSIRLFRKKDDKCVLKFDFSEFPILAIWSIPKAPFICLEPWYNMADKVIEEKEFKNKEGVITLNAKEEFNCSYSVSFFELE